MAVAPSADNHFILCSDGFIFDLLDVLTYDESIEKTINNIVQVHGEIMKATSNPLKIFEKISGLTKDGHFVDIGPTNWSNLFMIRGDFEYFLAYIYKNGERMLVANSTEGLFWTFNVIDA